MSNRNILGYAVIAVFFILALYVGGWLMLVQPLLHVSKCIDAGVTAGVDVVSMILKWIFAPSVTSILVGLGGLLAHGIWKE